MPKQAEQTRINDVIVYEQAQQHGWCRAVKTIKANAAATAGLEVGQVLEDDTGLKPVATGANAKAILLEPVDLATLKAGASSRVCLVRGPALVVKEALTITSGQETAALAALKVLGIEVRSLPVKMNEGLGHDAV